MTYRNDRRDFIKSSVAGLVTIPLLGLKTVPFSQFSIKDPDDFYLEDGLVYLNTGSLGPSPRWVPDRIYEITRILESNPVSENWGPLGKQMEEVRKKAAKFLNCSNDEIILTRNTTEGLSMVSSTLDLKSGDEILTTIHEHGGGEVGLYYKESVGDVTVRKLELPYPAKNKDQILSAVLKQITSKTRLLMLSHVSTITGMIMPIKQIAEEIQGKDIFFLVDGAQACGMVKTDVSTLGVHAYATSGHKWLLGPKETGLLYVNEKVQNRIKPVFVHSGYGSYSASSGTRNVAQFIALGEIFDWHMNTGQDVIEDQCRELGQYCYEQLSTLEGFQIISPEDPAMRSAMISAISLNKPNREVYGNLKEKDIIIKVLPKYNGLRFSTHIFNSREDVDKLIKALKEL